MIKIFVDVEEHRINKLTLSGNYLNVHISLIHNYALSKKVTIFQTLPPPSDLFYLIIFLNSQYTSILIFKEELGV